VELLSYFGEDVRGAEGSLLPKDQFIVFNTFIKIPSHRSSGATQGFQLSDRTLGKIDVSEDRWHPSNALSNCAWQTWRVPSPATGWRWGCPYTHMYLPHA